MITRLLLFFLLPTAFMPCISAQAEFAVGA